MPAPSSLAGCKGGASPVRPRPWYATCNPDEHEQETEEVLARRRPLRRRQAAPAIESYSEAIRYVGNDDPTTRRVLEVILAREEEHADDMADLPVSLDPKNPV